MSWARDVWPSERARLMSGHMMPTEREAAEATVVLELEEWLKDDLACASQSSGHDCTVEVSHVAFICLTPDGYFICGEAARLATERLSTGWRCDGCQGMARDCWRVVPI